MTKEKLSEELQEKGDCTNVIKTLVKELLRVSLYPVYQRSKYEDVMEALISYEESLKKSKYNTYAEITYELNAIKVDLYLDREQFYTLNFKFYNDSVINYTHLRNQLYSKSFYYLP